MKTRLSSRPHAQGCAAAQGLHGLQAEADAEQGLHAAAAQGLQAAAAQGLQAAAAQGLQALAQHGLQAAAAAVQVA